MFKRLIVGALFLAASGFSAGCAEDEIHTTHKSESQTESTPTDSSPGGMVVE